MNDIHKALEGLEALHRKIEFIVEIGYVPDADTIRELKSLLKPDRLSTVRDWVGAQYTAFRAVELSCDRNREIIDEKDAEIARLRERLRTTAQILIEQIGADGPRNAEESAREAAAEIARLKGEVETQRLALEFDRHKEADDRKEIARLTSVLEEARRRLDVGADPWQPPDAAERAVKFAKQFLDKALPGKGDAE